MGMTPAQHEQSLEMAISVVFYCEQLSKVRPWRAIIRRTTGHNKPKPRQLAAQPDIMLFMTNQARIANRTASH